VNRTKRKRLDELLDCDQVEYTVYKRKKKIEHFSLGDRKKERRKLE